MLSDLVKTEGWFETVLKNIYKAFETVLWLMHSMLWDRLQAHPMMQKWNSKKGTPTINEEILVWPFVDSVTPNDDLSEFVGPCLFEWACNLFHAELSWFHSKKFGLRLHVSFFWDWIWPGMISLKTCDPKQPCHLPSKLLLSLREQEIPSGRGASARKKPLGKNMPRIYFPSHHQVHSAPKS